MVKDEFLAEDIFQETFIKVINILRAGKYNDEGKFAQWVSRVAYNLCMDHFRKVKRLPAIVTSDGDEAFQATCSLKKHRLKILCNWNTLKAN